MASRFSVEAVFKAIDKVTAPVTRMQNRVGKLTRSMRNNFSKLNRVVNRFGQGIKKGAIAVTAALVLTSGAMASVISTGAEFEQAITNVGAVSLKTRDQIQPLEKLALELGRTTKFTATQAAAAMEIMSRAGFKTNEILTATPAVLAAAAASGLEIAEVADVVSNALKGMGLEATQAANVADILALASSRTNSSIGSLGESLKNVASTAKQLDVPLTDAVAAIALLQDVGLDASVAGSAFNVMLTKMAAPTAGIVKKMKKFGISFKDAKGNMLPLQKVLEQLNKASSKVGGNFDKVAFLAELVGLRGQKAAANLGDLFESGKLNTLTKELENAAGSANKMAEIRMDTFQGSMLLLGSAVDAVKVRIFGLNEGPLKGIIDNMTKWVSANEELIASSIGGFLTMVIENFGTIASAIGDVAIGIGSIFALSVALKAVAAVLGVINLIMAANPIVLGILAAVAAVALLSGALDPVLEVLSDIGSGIAKAFSAVGTLGGLFGFGGDDQEGKPQPAPQMVSPQERVARSIEEKRSTSTAEVTIKDDTGRAEITSGKMGAGVNLTQSGSF